MKTVCIYHKNCFDGICAAWVTSKRFPGCELRAFSYDMEFPFHEYDKEDRIIIVDFSFKRHVMLAIKEQCESLLVLDHHKTAEEACRGLDFCVFDMNESGASLAWKYFFPSQDLPWLVSYIKDRDLWLFKEPHSESINSYIQSFPMKIENYESLYNELEDEELFNNAIMMGESINRYKKTMTEAICDNYIIKNVGGYLVPVVNTSILFSEVGHNLCKLNLPSDNFDIRSNTPLFAAYYFDRVKDGIRQWGLRSIGDFDVSIVAKQLGGGGHKNAAGFEEKL